MGLSDYTPPQREISLGKGKSPLRVRGLCIEDFGALAAAHFADLEAVFGLYTNAGASLEGASAGRFVADILVRAPALAANVIALASDEPSKHEQARRLPMPVSIEALRAVLELTFEEYGPGKTMATIRALAANVRREAGQGRK